MSSVVSVLFSVAAIFTLLSPCLRSIFIKCLSITTNYDFLTYFRLHVVAQMDIMYNCKTNNEDKFVQLYHCYFPRPGLQLRLF